MPQKSVTVSPRLPDELPKPEAANFFSLNRVGHEVEILVGYVPLKRLVEILSESDDPGTAEVEPVITHTFALGPRGFVHLYSQVNEIFDAMKASGHLDATGLEVKKVDEEEADEGEEE